MNQPVHPEVYRTYRLSDHAHGSSDRSPTPPTERIGGTAGGIIDALIPGHLARKNDLAEPSPLTAMRLPTLSDGTLTYSAARVDSSGTVPAAQTLAKLRWHTGDRLAITTVREVVVISHDTSGLHSVPKKRSLIIPAVVRRACGIRPGDLVVLAAATELGILLIHPPTVLDMMMMLYHNTDRAI